MEGSSGEEALLARIRELEDAVRARDEFIAVAAHELRNPMTPLMGQVEVLARTAERENCSPAFRAGVERLQTIVSHYVKRATTLLEITRLNAGAPVLEPEAIDLAVLVRTAVLAYAPFAARSRCELIVETPDSLPAVLDPLAVEHVIDNLVSNAVKFGAGKPIRVILAPTAGGPELRVCDEGVGLSAADQARVFLRFEQAVGQRRGGGFGVGLWVVRQLVEAMGGAITVDSRLGEGATFRIAFPPGPPAVTAGRGGRVDDAGPG